PSVHDFGFFRCSKHPPAFESGPVRLSGQRKASDPSERLAKVRHDASIFQRELRADQEEGSPFLLDRPLRKLSGKLLRECEEPLAVLDPRLALLLVRGQLPLNRLQLLLDPRLLLP